MPCRPRHPDKSHLDVEVTLPSFTHPSRLAARASASSPSNISTVTNLTRTTWPTGLTIACWSAGLLGSLRKPLRGSSVMRYRSIAYSRALQGPAVAQPVVEHLTGSNPAHRGAAIDSLMPGSKPGITMTSTP